MERWAKDLTESVFGGPPFKIGDIVTAPDNNGKVLITQGQYWGTHGLSNFWYWRRVDDNNQPYGPEECGYGWRS